MVNPADDFIDVKTDDPKLSALVESMMGTETGKDRKTILTVEQALHIARARAFADSFAEYREELDDETGEIVTIMEEPPLMIVHLICDYLQNTAVSVSGKGLKQLVEVLTARQREQDENWQQKLGNKVTG